MSELTADNVTTEHREARLIALVNGEGVKELPKDLYIPPDALEVILETFEGPLDLLLYLIKRENLNIVEISIARVTEQYMDYITLMKDMRFELAAEYLVMAAMLAEIKSRMLLPKPKVVEDDETDPTAELIRRLQEYERYKAAATDLDGLPRLERDICEIDVYLPTDSLELPVAHTDLSQLLSVLRDVMKRAEMFSKHHIQREALSLRERMTMVLDSVLKKDFVTFNELFNPEEGKTGVIVTFLAILELLKESLVEIVQSEAFGPIHVRGIST